jgi:prepilin-type N-terminal cleavage/methylation domain-containing protein
MISRQNNKGFSLIEVAMATLVISVLIVSAMKVLTEVDEGVDRQLSLTKKDQIVAGIIDDIRGNLGQFQINFNTQEINLAGGPEAYLRQQELPVAWSRNTIVSVSRCKASKVCPQGRYGLVILPLKDSVGDEIPGLFEVTVLFEHTRLFASGFHTFSFVGSAK